MVVRIRVKLGAVRRKREPEPPLPAPKLRLWLNWASGVAFAVALWRLAYDLNLTGHFAIENGLFSHWQFWMALAVLLQVLDTMLGRRGHGGTATP